MKAISTMVLVALFGLAAAGCSDRSKGDTSVRKQGAGTGTTVGQLTGDNDDEVSAQLQAQVAEAFKRGENDEPVDF